MAIAGRSYPNKVYFVRPTGVDVSIGAGLTVTASITADGIVGGPQPAFVVNETAIQTATQMYTGLGKGFPNRPSYTWRSSTADAPGQGTANLAVTAAIVADGSVTVQPSPQATYVVNQGALVSTYLARVAGIGYPNVPIWSRSSAADVPNAGSANLAVTANIVTDGIVSASGPPFQVVNQTAIQAAYFYATRGYPNRPITARSSIADVIGSGTANLTVTDSITAAGTAGNDPALTVTAAITADGIIGLGPSPTYIVNDTAIQAAFFYATQGWPNRPVIETGSMQTPAGQGAATLTVTDSITATGAAGSDPALTITAAIVADGVVGLGPSSTYLFNDTAIQGSTDAFYRQQGFPNRPKLSRSSFADVLGAGSATLTVTASISAAGTVGVTGQAALTVTFTVYASPLPPAVPPITVTGSSSPAATVTGSSSPAATVAGSTAPAITVH